MKNSLLKKYLDCRGRLARPRNDASFVIASIAKQSRKSSILTVFVANGRMEWLRR
jgi:hypothetical protein